MTSIDFDGPLSWERVSKLEWLETNGIGGWAGSTLGGANSRRYHGILVPALHPPLGRIVLLSKLDETLDGIELATNRYAGAVSPRGFEHLRKFERDLFPQFTFAGDGWTLTKTVAAIHGENTTVVSYELTSARAMTLELRPFLAARDYHSISHANDSIDRHPQHDDDGLLVRTYDGIPPLRIFIPNAEFDAKPDWYYSFAYEREEERGFDEREDLFTPGVLRVAIAPGEPLHVVATIDRITIPDGGELLEGERARRNALLTPASPSLRSLVLAADQFIVRRGAEGRTIVAGYHWFGDWGRDTMIALPGLCLATGRFDDARRILLEFASVVSEGMLPNRFPDSGEQPEYNTVDATLWFFAAIESYITASGDEAFAAKMLPLLVDIVQWHDRGTRHGIRVADDGLLRAGEPGVQLTWMDARVGDRVITPREGKPVEIQALWYNALRMLAALHQRLGNTTSAGVLEKRAARVQQRFNDVFWNERLRCLYDVIADDGTADDSVRPNQILAVSLPYPIVEGERAAAVLDIVEKKLLTKVGLRSLSPDDRRYAGHYRGSPSDRDAVYHQGTVWSWLLGPYISALVRVRGENGLAEARALFADAATSLLNCCGIATVAEIFDGDPPHEARGCVAQAWSVGELLRVAAVELGAYSRGGAETGRAPAFSATSASPREPLKPTKGNA